MDYKKVKKSEKTVKWGILSTAEIATKVVMAMHTAVNAEVIAVASRSTEKALYWADKHLVPRAYGTYEELLDDPQIEAVYIPLPTALRKEWAIKAANKGKHVLMEKPTAPNLTDLTQVTDACERNNRQYMDGTMWLHSNRTHHIKNVSIPKVGEIRRITAAFTFAAPDEKWIEGGNGRTDASREPMGCLGDQGWYPLSAILFGFDYTLPTKVLVTQARFNSVNTIITIGGTLWFPPSKEGGVERIATFDCGCELAHRSSYEFVGTKGVVKVEDLTGGQGHEGLAPYFTQYEGSGSYFLDDVEGRETIVNVEKCIHEVKMIEDFSELVLSKKVDRDWARRSLAMQAVLDAIFLSAKEDQVVHLDSKGTPRIESKAVPRSLPSDTLETKSTSSQTHSKPVKENLYEGSCTGNGLIILGTILLAAAVIVPRLLKLK